MSKHITNTELQEFIRNELPPDELLRIDDHLSSCRQCRDALAVNPATANAMDRLTHVLAPSAGEHLRYDQIERLIDNHLSGNEHTAAEAHLAACRECRGELSALRSFANDAAYAERPQLSLGERLRTLLSWPVLAAASAAVLLIAAGAFLITESPDSTVEEIAVDAQPTISVPPDTSSPVDIEGAGNNTEGNQTELALTLVDGTRTIGLDDTGSLVGYEGLSPAERRSLENVLRSGSMPIAQELRELRGANAATMGDSDPAQDERFDLIGPIGKVVNASSPRLRWKPLAGSNGYRVDVFDANYNKVASSATLSSTSWSPRLTPGKTYIWQVTALKSGKEFRSPVRPASEARFRLLDKEQQAKIARLRKQFPGSHLLLGIAYARAGLIEEAKTEMRAFAKANPGKPFGQRLLRQLQEHR
jgi:hypothetical protein